MMLKVYAEHCYVDDEGLITCGYQDIIFFIIYAY